MYTDMETGNFFERPIGLKVLAVAAFSVFSGGVKLF